MKSKSSRTCQPFIGTVTIVLSKGSTVYTSPTVTVPSGRGARMPPELMIATWARAVSKITSATQLPRGVSPSSSPDEGMRFRVVKTGLSVMTAIESRKGWSIVATARSSPSEGRTGISAPVSPPTPRGPIAIATRPTRSPQRPACTIMVPS